MSYIKLLFASFLLSLNAISVSAASVTMQSSWLHSHGASSLGTGNLVFTYDDQIADTSVYSYKSTYANPFLSGSFSFDSKTFTFDTTQASSISITPFRGAGTDISISATMFDIDGVYYKLSLGIETNSKLPSGLLSSMEGQRCNDSCSLLIYPPNPTPATYIWLSQSSPLTSVPVPAAAWLFGSGLLGLIGAARHKAA